MKLTGQVTFDPDFASPGEWAAAYRAHAVQVVPSRHPAAGAQWKIPALNWKEFQDNLVPSATFERWYGVQGEHAKRVNMGLITGRASSNIFVIDLDEYKSTDALSWWLSVLAEHNNGMEPDTWQQVTGGGGRQLFFRGSSTWEAPTNRTKINVDIRGQGGFAVLPPSLHDSGRNYSWKVGCAPWEIEICDAPDWLMEAVDKLVLEHGGDSARNTVHAERTSSPDTDYNAFGARVDGREEKMRDMVWANVVDWYRECPLPPSREASDARMRDLFSTYERGNKSRLQGAEPNAIKLEKEGRGHTLFAEKWRRAIAQWDEEIAVEAGKPKPGQIVTIADAPKINPDTGEPLPLLQTAAQFVAGFRPPQYLIGGMVQQSYLYALTARTGHGKTAVCMYAGQNVARGLKFHGRETKQGSVLFLAGENPDDVRARFLVLADHEGFDPSAIPFYFVDGVVDIAASLPRIRAEAENIPNLSLVVVDTAAAYFRGDDGNNNSQQGEYARLLRQLTFLPGKPACIVNCHPVKNASKDNLLPVGGGAFLNEVDGNLTLWSNAEKQASLHWQGKFRGPEFEPMAFEMRTHESAMVVDDSGECMPSVVAAPIGDTALERGERGQEDDENLILKIIAASPRASVANIAIAANFISAEGKPQKSKTQRIIMRLLEDKMIEKHRGSKFRPTKKGKKEIGIDDDDD